jgi:hypothetical protein
MTCKITDMCIESLSSNSTGKFAESDLPIIVKCFKKSMNGVLMVTESSAEE